MLCIWYANLKKLFLYPFFPIRSCLSKVVITYLLLVRFSQVHIQMCQTFLFTIQIFSFSLSFFFKLIYINSVVHLDKPFATEKSILFPFPIFFLIPVIFYSGSNLKSLSLLPGKRTRSSSISFAAFQKSWRGLCEICMFLLFPFSYKKKSIYFFRESFCFTS